MEAVGFPETSLRLYQTTQHNIRQDRNICTDMRRLSIGLRSDRRYAAHTCIQIMNLDFCKKLSSGQRCALSDQAV